jgi:hypothetical protein
MKKAWLASLLVAAGCATATPEAQRVRVTQNPQATQGCKFLGNVEAQNVWGPADTEVRLRVAADRIGANVLFLGPHVYQQGVGRGEAYLCEQPKTETK